jgi:ubiquinone/menaquinone biosynthesis C-methylase UbiE
MEVSALKCVTNDVAKVKNLNREAFDRQASFYDSEGWGRFTLPLLTQVLETVKVPDGGRLLDVGCGTGAFLASFAARGGSAISGVDLSPEMIRLASNRLNTGAELRVGDSENLPWPDGTFDTVTCSSSFHHYPQPRKALAEMRRVLKPGGQLVLADFWLPAPLRQLANVFLIPFAKDGDVRVYSRREVAEMIQSAGLSLLSWKRVGLSNYVAEAKAR